MLGDRLDRALPGNRYMLKVKHAADMAAEIAEYSKLSVLLIWLLNLLNTLNFNFESHTHFNRKVLNTHDKPHTHTHTHTHTHDTPHRCLVCKSWPTA